MLLMMQAHLRISEVFFYIYISSGKPIAHSISPIYGMQLHFSLLLLFVNVQLKNNNSDAVSVGNTHAESVAKKTALHSFLPALQMARSTDPENVNWGISITNPVRSEDACSCFHVQGHVFYA